MELVATDFVYSRPSTSSSYEEKQKRVNTNSRYPFFRQQYFTAGDADQFLQMWKEGTKTFQTVPQNPSLFLRSCRETKEGHLPIRMEECRERCRVWSPEIRDTSILTTFDYLFHTMKKGIFISIRNGKLDVFLPFSKVNYTNTWGPYLQWDKQQFPQRTDMFRQICERLHYPFDLKRVHHDPIYWYANNGLIRYECPTAEGDSGYNMLHDMLHTLCTTHSIPDIDFFINKRDFPMIRVDGNPAYEQLYDQLDTSCPRPLVSSKTMIPILSMTTTKSHADFAVPTWEDWCRASYQLDQRLFGKEYRTFPTIPWVSESHSQGITIEESPYRLVPFSQRRPTAVFRGSSTGLGCRYSNNPRLEACRKSLQGKCSPHTQQRYLDCGITKWNLRPRKVGAHLEVISSTIQEELPIVNSLTLLEQCQYKYILHLPGHSCAYRLSYELSSGSVVLLYPSRYRLWFMDLLKPYVHYVPVQYHLGKLDIYRTIDWCITHEEECKRIAQQARQFYDTFLSVSSILSYWKELLTVISEQCPCLSNHSTSFPSFWELQSVYEKAQHSQHILASTPSIPFRFTEEIETYLQQTSPHYESNHVRIWKYKNWCIKESLHPDENLHEWYTWKNIHTSLPPNSTYTQCFYDPVTTRLITSWVDGIPVDKWLIPEHFGNHTQEAWTAWLHVTCRLLHILQSGQHSRGWIHFDVYPWNVLVTSQHEPVLIDFGKSAFLDEERRLCYRIQPLVYPLHDMHDISCWIYSSLYFFASRFHLTSYHLKSMFQLLYGLGCPSVRYLPRTPQVGNLKRILRHYKKFATGLSPSLLHSTKPAMTLSHWIKHCFVSIFPISFSPTYHLASPNSCTGELPLPEKEWTWSSLPTFSVVQQEIQTYFHSSQSSTFLCPSSSLFPTYPTRPDFPHVIQMMKQFPSSLTEPWRTYWDAYCWIFHHRHEGQQYQVMWETWFSFFFPWIFSFYHHVWAIHSFQKHWIPSLESSPGQQPSPFT